MVIARRVFFFKIPSCFLVPFPVRSTTVPEDGDKSGENILRCPIHSEPRLRMTDNLINARMIVRCNTATRRDQLVRRLYGKSVLSGFQTVRVAQWGKLRSSKNKSLIVTLFPGL